MTPLRASSPAAAGLLAALLVLAGTAAGAAAVAGGANEPGRRPLTVTLATPSPAAQAPSLDLVAARLEAVDLAAGHVTVRGQRVPLHLATLRVFDAAGQAATPRHLRAGQSVRLALEPLPVGIATPASAAAAASGRRIVLIYIDA